MRSYILLKSILFIAILFVSLHAYSTIFIKKVILKGELDKSDSLALEKIVSDYENKNLTVKNIYELKKKLNKYYKNKKQLFTKVILPKQTVENKSITFLIVKSKVGKIKVLDNRFFSKKFIKNNLDFSEGKILKYKDLLHSLLLLNEINDLSVKSFLKKGEKFGETDVYLKVKDSRPFHGNLMFDNLGSENTSKYRTSLNINYGNLFNDGDFFNLWTTIGNKNNSKLYRTKYITTPFGKYHMKMNFSYLYANYVVSGDLSILDLKGNTHIYEAGFDFPLFYSDKDKVDIGLNYQKQKTKSYILGTLSSKDDLNLIIFSNSWKSSNIFSRFNFTFLVTKAFDSDTTNGSRNNSQNNFSKFNFGLTYDRFINDKNYYKFTLNTQYTLDRLPISQMMSLGGMNSIRGFDSSVKLGDKGYITTFEWYHNPKLKDIFKNTTLGVFVDAGLVEVNQPIVGEEKKNRLIGGGVELISTIKERYSTRLGVGFPIYSSYNRESDKGKIFFVFNAKLW